ncbi:hypothetical protein A2U01_0046004, partial [Trifolium medium]|nr:hypothetical protein [Trifolium medium]
MLGGQCNKCSYYQVPPSDDGDIIEQVVMMNDDSGEIIELSSNF